MTADPHAVAFDLLSPAFQDDPAAMFAALRDRCPVAHTTVPSEHYTLSRSADVLAALRDDDTWSSKFGPGLVHGEKCGAAVVQFPARTHGVPRARRGGPAGAGPVDRGPVVPAAGRLAPIYSLAQRRFAPACGRFNKCR